MRGVDPVRAEPGELKVETVHKDVVVIGLGAFGSAALWRLAQRGADVAGIERHGIGHRRGSSHGATRLFRIACLEHPGLVPIARKSLELWTSLGTRLGRPLARQTGCLSVGTRESRPVSGAIKAATVAGVPVVELGHDELVGRQPQYAGLEPEDIAVWDPGAGICYPERNVRAHTAAARNLGADVHAHTPVSGFSADRDGVTVRTPAVEFRASQVVVAAGAWLGALVPELPLAPRETTMHWFRPRDPASADFGLDRFPAFIWERGDGSVLWGHGSDEDYGIKLGLVRADSSTGDEADLTTAMAEALPGLDPHPAKAGPCMITDSPDGQFLVGRPPSTSRVVVAGGDSGHGFKHAAGVGELLAQIVAGEPPFCATDFLDPRRFQGDARPGA